MSQNYDIRRIYFFMSGKSRLKLKPTAAERELLQALPEQKATSEELREIRGLLNEFESGGEGVSDR